MSTIAEKEKRIPNRKKREKKTDQCYGNVKKQGKKPGK
jgi:hypothetical protein